MTAVNTTKKKPLLIGPLPYIRSPRGVWAPDYNHPGVAERIRAEVDEIEILCYRKGLD